MLTRSGLALLLLLLAPACKQEKYEVGKRDDIKAYQKKRGVTPGGADAVSSGSKDCDEGSGSGSTSADCLVAGHAVGSGSPVTGGNGSSAIVIQNGSGGPVGSGSTSIVLETGSGSAAQAGTGSYDAAQAADFLGEACADCHTKGRSAMAARWGFEPGANAVAAVDAKAYWSMKAKSRGVAAGEPPPMPSGVLTSSARAALDRFLAWFEAEKPVVVEEARRRFEKTAPEGAGATNVILVYKCERSMSYRRFLARITEDFFDRPPRLAELELPGAELDLPVTAAQRDALATRLTAADGWRTEFETVTLRKFAERLSGAAQIKPLPGLSEDQTRDLKQELYQLLLARHAEKSYRDILLDDEIMVSPNTAALYGCGAAAGWASCTPPAPRGSYFTSVSFLASKPSSFLSENNNYGRVKLLHFLISGDVFKSSVDGGAGDGAVPPLPACLKTNDWRGTLSADKKNVAAYGAASIPASGIFCQSCHIARHMAAGSILFRPFSASGLVYGQKARMDLDPALADATGETRVNDVEGGSKPRVTKALLEGLLAGGAGEAACAPDLSGRGQDVRLGAVKDLAQHLIGDGTVLATGLARHIPRVLSNQSLTTDEVVDRVGRALGASHGRIDAAFGAYLSSETYACEP